MYMNPFRSPRGVVKMEGTFIVKQNAIFRSFQGFSAPRQRAENDGLIFSQVGLDLLFLGHFSLTIL